jgi:predicted  nucleic acid-binding Zn-ribbon protein
MEAVKLLTYMDAIPSSLQGLLKQEQFGAYAEVCITSEQIDIVVENLGMHFVLNEQLNIDNPALVSFSRDLAKALVRFQYYLNLLRGQMVACSRQSEFEELIKTDFYQKMYHSFGRIRDIYELVRTNELSTQFSFSEITESALELKQDLSESMVVTPENHIKSIISSMVTLLSDKFFDTSLTSKERGSIQAACKKLVHIQEKIYDSKVTANDLEQAKHLASACPQNVAEIRHWADAFCKALDEAEMDPHQAKEKIANAFWKEPITAVRTELDKHEALNCELDTAQKRIRELEEEDDKKSKAIAALNKDKITLDSKVVKLKIISNNFSALEMELADLRRSEKNNLQTIDELQNKLKTAETDFEQKKGAGDKFGGRRNAPSIIEPSRTAKASMLRPGMAFGTGEAVGDITGRNSIEINSLSSILSNSLAKLNEVRSQNASQRLNKLLQKTDAFSAVYQAHFQPNKSIGTVGEILDNIRNNQADIKREVARLNVISLAENSQTSQSLNDFYQKQNNIANLLSKNRQWLEEFVKVTQARELEYHPDIKKEILGTAESASRVYGKLTVLKEAPPQVSPANAKVVNLDLSILLK